MFLFDWTWDRLSGPVQQTASHTQCWRSKLSDPVQYNTRLKTTEPLRERKENWVKLWMVIRGRGRKQARLLASVHLMEQMTEEAAGEEIPVRRRLAQCGSHAQGQWQWLLFWCWVAMKCCFSPGFSRWPFPPPFFCGGQTAWKWSISLNSPERSTWGLSAKTRWVFRGQMTETITNCGFLYFSNNWHLQNSFRKAIS